MALTNKLSAIGDAIRGKTGKTDLLTLDEMATEITAIEAGGGGGFDEEDLTITGDCTYKFSYSGWNWYLDKYKDKIKCEGITNAHRMFSKSTLTEIPIELGFSQYPVELNYMFEDAASLTSIPKFNNCKPKSLSNIFRGCTNLRYLPEDLESYFDWTYIDNLTNMYAGNTDYMFYYCHSLRSIPMGFLKHGNPVVYYYYNSYYNAFFHCYALDEIVGLPIPHAREGSNLRQTSNMFNKTFENCSRLKNITFETNADGTPINVRWHNQVIDIGTYVGRVPSIQNVTNYNSGITQDKLVNSAETYEALKNDPDWFTNNLLWSRYNHDSAVATINSLPNTVENGANTIKFIGTMGQNTDGGAINTLTEEEIAVATAKGWTVTLT